MLLSICDSRENWRGESSTFLTGVYDVTFLRVTPNLRYSKVKNALAKSVCYTTERSFCSVFIIEMECLLCDRK